MCEQDFFDQLKVSEAGREYLDLIEQCKVRALVPEQGYEIHHIHPSGIGGSNTNQNKVKVTVFEHCKAHALLAKAIPCYKTLQPLTYLTVGQVSKLEDLEKLELEDVYGWSKLREKALHHPKSPEHRQKMSEGAKGKKHSKEHVEKRVKHRVGKVTVNNGVEERFISELDLDSYLALGWVRGMTEQHKQVLRERRKGKVGQCLGRKCISKDGKELKVRKEELEKYLSEGWRLGRADGFVENYMFKMKGKTNKGKVRINKDGIGKVVLEEELQKYLEDGWVRGIVRK